MQHAFSTDDVWSDFNGGSDPFNYFNGAAVDAKTISDLSMGQEIWDPADAQVGSCTKMTAASQYRLTSADCTGSEAKYACIKPGKP